jgi:hypothetical protein
MLTSRSISTTVKAANLCQCVRRVDDVAAPATSACNGRVAEEPKLSAPGIGYMLQGGGSASNTDPFTKKPAPGDTWMKEPPHIMWFPAGKLDAGVYSTDMHSGGPWIMWGGTPYEHLMVPVQ